MSAVAVSVKADPHTHIWEISSELALSLGTVLHMKKLAAKWIPHKETNPRLTLPPTRSITLNFVARFYRSPVYFSVRIRGKQDDQSCHIRGSRGYEADRKAVTTHWKIIMKPEERLSTHIGR